MEIYQIVVDEDEFEKDYLVDFEGKTEIEKRKETKEILKCELVNDFSRETFCYCLKKMALEKKLYILPENCISFDNDSFGLPKKVKDRPKKRVYDRYLSKREKCKINKLLSDEIKDAYNNAQGHELESDKFYSIGSSSRLAVSSFSEIKEDKKLKPISKIKTNEKSKNNVKVRFEVPLPICGMPKDKTAPQMDVMLEDSENNKTYFIEVKCQEIFDNHNMRDFKYIYKTDAKELFDKLPLNDDIREKLGSINRKDGDFIVVKDDKERYLTYEDFGITETKQRFDLKQFICHLMGIISYKQKIKHKDEDVYFYYLFFRNKDLDKYEDFSEVYNELEKEINTIYGKFENLFKEHHIHFGYCYNNQFSTLKSLKNELKNSK